jgi:hypothetical protein
MMAVNEGASDAVPEPAAAKLQCCKGGAGSQARLQDDDEAANRGSPENEAAPAAKGLGAGATFARRRPFYRSIGKLYGTASLQLRTAEN